MSVTEAHLVKLQTYLSKHLRNRAEAQCIQNELLTTYFRSSPIENVSSFVNNRTCPRCFNTWNEGNLSIKTKYKKSKSHVNKQVIIKCLICQKSSIMHRLSRKHGVRWKCAEDHKTNQHLGNEKSSKASSKDMQGRKLEAIAGSSARENCYEDGKKRKKRTVLKANRGVEEIRRAVKTNILNDSLKKKRRQKCKMTSKFSRTHDASNMCNTSGVKQKKVALTILNDLL